MGENSGLKVIGIIAAIVLVVVVIANRKSEQSVHLDKSTQTAVGSQSGDTINESLHVFSAKYQKLIDKLDNVDNRFKLAEEDNKALRQEVARLKSIKSIKKNDELTSQLKAKISLVDQKINQLSKGAANNDSYKVHTAKAMKSHQVETSEHKLSMISDNALTYALSTRQKREWGLNKKPSLKTVSLNRQSKKESQKIPYYTLPAGSDLGNVTLLQALIGEVPSEEKLQQPLFPFSVMVSRGSLMSANGISLPPDVMGMKFSGYSVGVGSFLDGISCVRSYVTSALFVFQDGHFVTVGEERMNVSANLMGSGGDKTLGYLTTPFGNPCMPGKYYTNAPRVLAAMGLTGGIQGAGAAISQWQMTYYTGPNGAAAAPTGNMGTYLGGAAASEGAVQAAEWMKKRISGSFDMVFIPASVPYKKGNQISYRPNKVSLHLTKTIDIDKAINGRRIFYGNYQNYISDNSLK